MTETQITISFTLNKKEQEEYNALLDWMTNIDMFRYDYIGSIATKIAGENGDFLLWSNVDEEVGRNQVNDNAAIFAWENNHLLPRNYYRLNKELASKAIQAGIKQKGINFLEEYDAGDIYRFLQIALFGETLFC